MTRLAGKTALVTGGAAGLGRSHALALAREGADVALFDLGDEHAAAEHGYSMSSGSELDAAVDEVRHVGVRAIGLRGDVRRQADLDDAVARVVEELGRIDILVANAGIGGMAALTWEIDEVAWERMFAVNLAGVWHTCKAVVPRMVEQRYGRIVLKSSITGLRSAPRFAAYAVAKAGVIRLGETLALEVAQYGITVNMICPTTVPTGASRGVAEMMGVSFDEWLRASLEFQAIKATVQPEDISHAVVFLASDEARYITGVSLPVDAGAHLVWGRTDS
jgi:NAD(P)-dependent dehydrogenase (short-subunit alcohol dehydrogenase family)